MWKPPGPIPRALREFGKYPDTSRWWPGDLVLTRALKPNSVSRAITKAQINGGYAPDDSEWTHAAVYLGDGLNVCEATVDSIFRRGTVRVSRLWDYCADHFICIRRSTFVKTQSQGWLMAITALTNLQKDYDFSYVARLALLAARGRGFWQTDIRVPIRPSALVCSTLYSDTHNRVTRHILTDNGVCVPAQLSQCTELKDVASTWLKIAR